MAARQPIAPGGVRLWGRFRVRGGVLPQRTIPRTFRGYLLGRYTRAPAFRVARTVCIGVLVRLLRVSLLHMSPFTNIIHSHSNVLLHMSQSRALRLTVHSLLILLFPALNTNLMLNAIFGVCIAYGMATFTMSHSAATQTISRAEIRRASIKGEM